MVRRTRTPSIGDPILFALVIALSIFGIGMVFSAGVLDVHAPFVRGAWRMQLLWFGVALLVIPVVMRIPMAWLEMGAKPIYFIALLMLALTPFIGTGAGTAEGVPRWLGFGPVRIQTAEVAKLAVIIMLAKILGDWREPPKNIWGLWKPIAVVLPAMAFVMMQPDIGTTLVFAVILIAGLYWVGPPLPTLFLLVSPAIGLFFAFSAPLWAVWFLFLVLCVVIIRPKISESVSVLVANVIAGTIAIPLWESLADYQKNRILVFLDPAIDPRGAGYNLIQSRVAIGSGGIFGKGFTEGTQKRLAFLPEQHTDFIFSVVGEELGFVGVAAVLLAFGWVFWRLIRIAQRSPDPFASMIPFGLFASWFVHVLVNTGMTVGVMPITGIPLPFVSYGGSFLLVNLVAMAIVLRVAAESRGGT